MRTMSKKLLSITTAALITAGFLGNVSITKAATLKESSSRTAAVTSGKYATNPDGKVGKKATITIDGSFSDWSDDMLIAQGAAWDIANNWKGGHENCVLDSYALYAAWDDDNLYIGWQMVNTTDTWANPGDGPLSDGGRVLDVPLVIALDVGNKNAMTGKVTDGKGIWGLQVEYETRVDHLFFMSGKVGLGTPAMFTAVDSSGAIDYLDDQSCQSFKDTGIQYKMAEAALPKSIWGLENSSSPSDVYSSSANWVDMMTKGHNTTYDSFYEMSIPLSVLGIDKSYIEANGIGVMQLSTRGVSSIDCLPHDPSMLDNATGDCAVDPSTSHEKDDTDIITVPLASIGKLRNGATPPPITNGTVKVKYVDESGNEIATSTTMTGTVGTSYTTSAKTISGYTLKTTPSNASGTYSSGTTTVTYVYSKNTPPSGSGTVNVKYVDESGNEIATSTIMTGTVGTSYTTSAKTISGYTLKTTPSNASGTYKSGTTTVTYVYSKSSTPPSGNGTVTVKYVDASTGLEIKSSTVMTGAIGSSYKTTAPSISGYTLASTPSNASGTYRDGNIIVTYRYSASPVVSKPVINSFTSSKINAESGTKVTLKANATGSGTLQYKFLIKDNKGNWYKLRDYSTSNSYVWTTGSAGNKTLYVDVKDSKGNTVRKEMSYTVKQGKIQDNSSSITYTGNWSVSSNAAHSGGTCKYIAKTGSATYKFNGTGIKLIAATGKDKGLAKITIDGNDVYYVDMYSDTNMRAQEVFMIDSLKSGNHTVKVEWTGLKFGKATNSVITLDAFEVIQ